MIVIAAHFFESAHDQWDGRSHPKRNQMRQSGSAINHLIEMGINMKITTIGIDLAKLVFQIHWVDDHGKTVLKKQIKRDLLPAFLAKLEPRLICMEDRLGPWLDNLQARMHANKVVVALANKLTRIAWVVLNRPGAL